MTPKATSHVIQGMQKDTSKSKLSKEFAFDAKNIRITAREDNTLLTITNEKGNKQTESLFGSYLGHCVLNNQLVLFTTTPNAEIKDHIFLYDSEFNQTPLYSGNLNFSLDNPLETLGVYENEDIQKVYWVDGINQPRVINIKGDKSKFSDSFFDFVPELKLKETVEVEAINNSSLFAPGVIQYAFSYYNKYGQESNIFNTTPLCYLSFSNRGASPEEIIRDRAFKIKVSNLDTNFEYIRIYSIHRTSLNAVPTTKRVIDLPIIIPEEYTEIKESVTTYDVSNYTIGYYSTDFKYDSLPIDSYIKEYETTEGTTTETKYSFSKSSIPVDYNNQYLVLYDIEGIEKERIKVIGNTFYIITERTTLPGAHREIVRKTLSTKEDNTTFITTKIQHNNTIPSIEYIDNGTLGETIDPTQLLYIGGEDLIAGTITQKDNTLFLGNIKLNKLSITQDIKDRIKNTVITPQRRYIDIGTEEELLYSSDYTIVNKDSYFRAGEHYRIGIQFQHKSGKWSEPIYITDYTTGVNQRPRLSNGILSLPSFSYTLEDTIVNKLTLLGYKRMRGLVVLPEEKDRKILAQGILCPTVFNEERRKKNDPHTQSSWFIRPNIPENITEDYFKIKNNGTDLPVGDNTDYINKGSTIEFRHRHPIITGPIRGAEIQNEVEFIVDQSILNFYSPDIENKSININNLSNIQFKIVGIVNFTSNYGDIDITTKTPTLSSKGLGFVHFQSSNLESGGTGLISGLYYNDEGAIENPGIDHSFYMVYPWNKTGSLNTDSASEAAKDKRTQSAILEKKKISNIKFSNFNTWLKPEEMWYSFKGNSETSLANGISNIEYFNSSDVTLFKLKSNISNISYNYYGNVDMLLTKLDPYNLYYGESYDSRLLFDKNIKSEDPVRIKYKTSPHLIFKLNNAFEGHEVVLPSIQNINSVNGNEVVEVKNPIPEDFGVEAKYRQTDTPDSPELDDLWIKTDMLYSYETISSDPILGDIIIENYEPIIRVLICKGINTEGGKEIGLWEEYCTKEDPDKLNKVYYLENNYTAKIYSYEGRRKIKKDEEIITIENYKDKYIYQWRSEGEVNMIPTEVSKISVYQDSLSIIQPEYPYLYLAELYVDSEDLKNAFGGNVENAIMNNIWIPASQSISIGEDDIIYEYGDTRYQRYDCLKTYAFTPEDENQVIEIASFMCETRVNMLGRYDKNIGSLSNLNADPTNFNLFNPVYSQRDNFFNYRILDSDFYKLDKFNNTITWSKEKFAGEDVDTWTNITMASTLDLDGTKGKVNKLITFKDQIFAFQDKGISNILFNSRVQIPVSDGVPVEISNGMKVDGSRYISDNIGCQNKNSIVTTPSGVYFLDSESNGIYLLADGLTNLSTNKGFDIWTKEVSKDPSFKSFYDKNEKDVYFTTKDYCLGYSEKLGQFTSFYDYTDVETMFNIGTGFYSIKANSVGDQSIYQHSVGNYNEFYGEIKPYHLTIISNEDPQVDKVFTNLDYRADFFDSNNNYLENESFDTLEVWNEYQSGKETLKYSKFRPSNLKKKFRMWGANIPRDKKNKLDRMRNPWLYIKLSKEKPGTSKMELHDLVVKYLE